MEISFIKDGKTTLFSAPTTSMNKGFWFKTTTLEDAPFAASSARMARKPGGVAGVGRVVDQPEPREREGNDPGKTAMVCRPPKTLHCGSCETSCIGEMCACCDGPEFTLDCISCTLTCG